MGIDFKSFFQDGANFVLGVFKDSLIQKLSQTKQVQTEVAAQQVAAGKNVLWQYFPFMVIGILAVTLITRFKT